MKITLTGTGTSQGIPMIGCYCPVCSSADPRDNRTRTSAIIQSASTTVVLDTGPDFRQQILRERISHLDAVVFTHGHKDHTAGLDDIRPFNYLQGKIIDVYAEEAVQKILRREYAYAFDSDYPGIPRISLQTITTEPFQVGDMTFIPVRAMHLDLPVLGFRVGKFGYLTDANFITEEEMEKLRHLDVLVINALRLEKHYSHFNFEEALDIIDKLQPKQAYFTHISHHFGLHRDIEAMCPKHMTPGYDGLSFVVD